MEFLLKVFLSLETQLYKTYKIIKKYICGLGGQNNNQELVKMATEYLKFPNICKSKGNQNMNLGEHQK